ncbi:tripartite tricarboxylate transporter TctB family protein [Roseibium marinum]|uniref:Tripartite tricarboxylate transporter TctB family protein n=1 Tax=Roseibium marinum TaxID=281252 RepID=A0A2S3UKB0_9HYPH|nr:tripartite tricarboxylate transporter TctB family protein [Roseibium marinum]POF27939.1 tripartite tricarboxylate transporter TctB family protein [Roseibium marinum]
MDEARKDIIGGALLFVAGIALATHCYLSYDLGSLRRMGTGLYPMLAGLSLAGLSLAILLPAFLRGIRPGRVSLPPVRASIFVLLAVAAFALLCESFGLFPAIAAMVVLASLAGPQRPSLGELLIVTVVLCALAWLIFGLGLSLGLKMLAWPW